MTLSKELAKYRVNDVKTTNISKNMKTDFIPLFYGRYGYFKFSITAKSSLSSNILIIYSC